jgi:hypothetical protein
MSLFQFRFSISFQFHQCFTRAFFEQNFGAKNCKALQSVFVQNFGTKNVLLYKNCASKMLMKLTPDFKVSLRRNRHLATEFIKIRRRRRLKQSKSSLKLIESFDWK